MGEVCDDGNLNDTDDCANNCQPSCTLTNSCAAEDGDSDGVNDDQDNCPMVSNPDQADCDEDGQGDLCDNDECPMLLQDQDSDGIADEEDNCPQVSNTDQADRDTDGLGDVCDERPSERDFILQTGVLSIQTTAEDDQGLSLNSALNSGSHYSSTPEYQLTGSLTP